LPFNPNPNPTTMSVITTNNIVTTVTVPAKAPTLVVRDIAHAAGSATVAAARSTLAVAAPVAASVATALRDWATLESARPQTAAGPTLSTVNRTAFRATIAAQQTPAQVLAIVSQTPLSLHQTDGPAIAAQAQEVVRTGTLEAVRDFADALVVRHQQHMRTEAMSILAESVAAAGLAQVSRRDETGYLIARTPGSAMTFRADLTVNDDGHVRLATDTDGFAGTACQEFTDRVFAEAAKRGLQLQSGARQSKVRISQQQRSGSRAPAAVRSGHSA
jgi:hypothetical protein